MKRIYFTFGIILLLGLLFTTVTDVNPAWSAAEIEEKPKIELFITSW